MVKPNPFPMNRFVSSEAHRLAKPRERSIFTQRVRKFLGRSAKNER
ncbi:MAG: hypothetical protein H0Z34_09560 [Brevibacillus sp.]|nr:hypothetical protein [Brevibacillus sp.]